MDCEQVGEILEQYHEGDASLKEHREVLAHVKGCEVCRQSLQGILYDLDLAAYTSFFQDVAPPKGFTDKILEALPGGEKKEASGKGRRAPSGSRIQPARGERKAAGTRLGRKPSSSVLKSARKTTTARRRDADKSGLFLQDQIFGSQEKKTGLIITYCEECGERIAAADFDSGAAIHYKNASYCSQCKGSVEGYQEEAKPAAGRRGGGRGRGPARPPSGRMAPVARPGKGVNVPLIGGIALGAAVVLALIVVVVLNLGDDGTVERPARPLHEGAGAKEANAGMADPLATAPAAPGADGSAVQAEVKAIEDLRRKEEEKKKEKERLDNEPYRLINSVWRPQAEEIMNRKEPDPAKKEGLFNETIGFWGTKIEEAREGKIKDETSGKVLTFPEEALGSMEEEIRRVRIKIQQWVETEVRRIQEETHALVNEKKWDEARKMAQAYPPTWEERYPDMVAILKGLLGDIDLWERNWKKSREDDLKAKSLRAIEVGGWTDLIKDQNDFLANWVRRPPEGDKLELEKDDDGRQVLRMTSSGTLIFAQFKNATKWVNYEIEFEMKNTAALVFALREAPNAEKRILGQLPSNPNWTKFLMKVDGVIVEILKDGEPFGSGPAEYRAGPFLFGVGGEGSVQLRNFKIKVNKVAD